MTYVFLFGAVLVLLAAVVAVSVLRGGAETAEEPALDELPPTERREAALEALRRAEFDYRTGKLPEEDYRELRRRYGRAVLDAEAAGPEGGVGGPAGESSSPAEAAGETACGACGAPVGPDARFCSGCGERLAGDGGPGESGTGTRTRERA